MDSLRLSMYSPVDGLKNLNQSSLAWSSRFRGALNPRHSPVSGSLTSYVYRLVSAVNQLEALELGVEAGFLGGVVHPVFGDAPTLVEVALASGVHPARCCWR